MPALLYPSLSKYKINKKGFLERKKKKSFTKEVYINIMEAYALNVVKIHAMYMTKLRESKYTN